MAEPKAKKKKKPSVVQDYLLYLVVRVAAVFIQMMEVNASLRLARGLGHGLYLIYHRGRERAIEHLRASFPEKGQAWLEKTARRSFEHIVMLAFDVINTSRLIRASTWHRYIELGEGMDRGLKLILAGRGVLMVTGHYGNFEISGVTLATFGLETYSIARPLDNRFINDYLLGVRQRQGQIIVDKKGATEHMLEYLQAGATLGFIADQNAGHKGMFVDFFGRKASTYKSIGLLAMEYNLPIIVGCCRRVRDEYRFRFVLTQIILPEHWKGQDDPLRWITEQYTAAIERFVRDDPEQYWWVHRRWKTRPKGEMAEKRENVK
jgi:Kdo2-lipid IVA lauroyltransferase/acyltransferase